MGKIFNAIDQRIIKPRVMNAEREGFASANEDIWSFYTQGDPVEYIRTGAYGNSVRSTSVSGNKGNYHYRIYLDPPEYHTGTYSGQKVLEEAQYHGSGILGRAGTWFESEQDIVEAVKKNFK